MTVTTGARVCRRCDEKQDVAEFVIGVDRLGRPRKSKTCATCRLAPEWRCGHCPRVAPREEFLNGRRVGPDGLPLYRLDCRECRNSRHEAWRADNPEYQLRADVGRYGLTLEQFHEWSERVDHRCEVCGEPPRRSRLDIDHCHDSGVVRGLLCESCNRGLGMYGDDPARLRAAADYLEARSA